MRTRILSALIVAPLFIAVVLWPGGHAPFPGWPFALLAWVLSLVALHEFYQGCRTTGAAPLDLIGVLVATVFLVSALPLPDYAEHLPPALTLLLLVSLVVEIGRKKRAPLRNLGPTWLGALYIGWLLPFAVRLRLLPLDALPELGWRISAPWMLACGPGALLLLFVLLTTSAVDTGAYFAGKGLGKHKMAPILSPGKTWEGAVGGLLSAFLVAWLVGAWIRLPVSFSLAAGGAIGIVAQLGDLTKSAMKREIGIKDFGTLLPGHGGVLDRFDSLLFTAPVVYWLAIFWGAG